MKRRRLLSATLLLAAATSPTLRLLAKGLGPAADGSYHAIRGNVGYYTNKGGTIGLYLPGGRPEGGVMIDTQFPDAATAALETLRKQGEITRFGILANTHHHGDHTGGNEIILPLADQSIIHQTAHNNLTTGLRKDGKLEGAALPKTTFTDNWSTNLPDGKESLTLSHFGPAHTGGDAVVHFQNANVAHLGDLLFNRRFPYIDPAAGGDILNWATVIKKIRQRFDRNTIYIFGHAAEGYPVFGTASDLKAFENYLRKLRVYVRKEMRRGTTLGQLKSKTITVPGASEWSFGERLRDVNLEVMYAALGTQD